MVILSVIETTSKPIVEIAVDSTDELSALDTQNYENGSLAWVVPTGAFYGLSGDTWYNQDGTGAYSSGG